MYATSRGTTSALPQTLALSLPHRQARVRVPLFFGSIDVGHGGTFAEPYGGEFGQVGVAWLKWCLMDDQSAGLLFTGVDCGLCNDPHWQVMKKQLA